MAGFLNACKQSSAILVPFLDTLITEKVREEDAALFLSAKGSSHWDYFLTYTQFLQTSIFTV